MKISVIIPLYNAELYIMRAVNSVLIQPNVVELILVDDGSTDESFKICTELAKTDERIRLLKHPGNRNKGVSATRNLGIINSTSPYIAFLDADDYYLPNRFRQTSECFSADDNIDGVYEMIGICTNSSKIKLHSHMELVKPEELFESLQPLGNKLWFSIDGLTVKKTIFEKTGLFDESLKTSEDTLQWFKMAAVAKLVSGNITYPVTITERRTDSLTTDRKLVNKNFNAMLFKLFAWCKKKDCLNSRKEMVLNKLLTDIFNSKYNNKIVKFFFLIQSLFKIIFSDPVFVLFQSKVSKIYIGNLIGYNQLLSHYQNEKIRRL